MFSQWWDREIEYTRLLFKKYLTDSITFQCVVVWSWFPIWKTAHCWGVCWVSSAVSVCNNMIWIISKCENGYSGTNTTWCTSCTHTHTIDVWKAKWPMNRAVCLRQLWSGVTTFSEKRNALMLQYIQCAPCLSLPLGLFLNGALWP